MTKIMGWNADQWAIAAERYARIEGPLPESTLAGANQLRMWWCTNYLYAPGEIKLLNVEGAPACPWAAKMFDQAFAELQFLQR